METAASDLPKIGKPALRALEYAGYSRLEQLTRVSEKEILALHGMGPEATRLLREALAEKAGPLPKHKNNIFMDFFLFDEERPSDSPFIEKVWYARSEQGRDFTSVAESHSEIVIVRYEGKTEVVVRGPETKATPATTPVGGDCFGIVFKLGTFMPLLLPRNLTDRREVFLPIASHKSFWLDSAAWEIPTFDNADTFVQRLVHEGLLVHDPVVSAVLQGQPQAFSPRTLQYRFVRAAGLPHKVIQQIERARRAASLLESGMSILDSVHETGYYDQSHLTNSLRRFLGQTPAQIAQMSLSDPQP